MTTGDDDRSATGGPVLLFSSLGEGLLWGRDCSEGEEGNCSAEGAVLREEKCSGEGTVLRDEKYSGEGTVLEEEGCIGGWE
jgi:hypothetical protein